MDVIANSVPSLFLNPDGKAWEYRFWYLPFLQMLIQHARQDAYRRRDHACTHEG